MKLENEFTVPAGIDEAWKVLLDVERVAPCLPGAAVEPGAGQDGEYNGTMTVKIGPITARYKGTVRILEADEAGHRAVMRAQAKDARGQGTAAATITSTMEEAADGTRVQVVTDMRVTGPAAQFGRGVMQDVSAKMMRQFAECLAQEMSGPQPAAAAGETWSAAASADVPSGGPAAGGEPAPAGEAAAAEPGQAAGEAAAAAAEPAQAAASVGGAGPSAETAAAGGDGAPAAEAAAGAGAAAGGAASAGAGAGGAEAGGAAAGAGPSAPPRPRPTPEFLDLADVSRDAVLKRAAPVVGAALLLLILLRIVRR